MEAASRQTAVKLGSVTRWPASFFNERVRWNMAQWNALPGRLGEVAPLGLSVLYQELSSSGRCISLAQDGVIVGFRRALVCFSKTAVVRERACVCVCQPICCKMLTQDKTNGTSAGPRELFYLTVLSSSQLPGDNPCGVGGKRRQVVVWMGMDIFRWCK